MITGIKAKSKSDPFVTEIDLNVCSTHRVAKQIFDTFVNWKNRFSGKKVKKLYFAV